MLGLLRRLTPLQRDWVQHFPLSAAQFQMPDVMVIDGHCHLDMLAREWKTSAEGAIQRTLQQAPDPRMRLHAVVSNCCFPKFWKQIPQVSPAVGVQVALTFGVHPRVVGNKVDWEQLNTLVKSPNCVGVGECGLDYTRPYLGLQKMVFWRQIHLAKQIQKPLVLHLRGKKGKDDEAYLDALQLLREAHLSRRHPIYLHCFVASWSVFLKWISSFNNVLLGMTKKSTETDDFVKVARSMPFERLALESDAPHLSPFPGQTNHSLMMHFQAGMIGRIRNVPTVVILTGAAMNVWRFYRIWGS